VKKEEFKFEDGFSSAAIHKVVPKDSHGAGISVLNIGDPHFRTENLNDIPVYIARIEYLVKLEKPTFVVILGDLLHCHERVHTTVLNKAYTFIHKIRKLAPLYVLVGNHDYINNSQFLTTHHWMNAMKEWSNVTIVDTGMVSTTPYGKFIFCPYVFPGKFETALNIIDTEWKSARTIFCHQEFYGCRMGAIESVEGDKWDPCSPFIISGHIHDKQRIQTNIFYTGSSIQHAFGESQDKTITMCHFDENIHLESIDLNLPRKKILYMNMEEVVKFEPVESEHKLRITLSGTYDEFKVFKKSKKYKSLVENNIKVVYRHKTLPGDELATDVAVNNDFYNILLTLVKEEQNSDMMNIYNEIFSERV